MYKVAIIQNDSEMMRYSWSDIRPMISNLGYSYDGYTANDIMSLFSKIENYDAIIIATNACNDTKIKESLDAHSQEINSFLNKGKGLAVLFQMKKDSSEFFNYLPQELRVKTIKRTEDLKTGDLAINENNQFQSIVCYPNRIDITKIKEHCFNNKHVNGLYWTYLQPENGENFNIILEDNSFYDGRRSLIISTREDFPFRIVISAIALDWQGHLKLWENTIRYVVEGKPEIGLITKNDSSSFDYRYFVSWLKVNKIPAHQYKSDVIQTKDIEFNIHSIYIIDPIFTESETAKFVSVASPFIDNGKAEIIFFNENKMSKPYIALISNVRQFQAIALNAIIWIKNQFPADHGYFAKSFWNTLDVITTLEEFGIPTNQYKEAILSEIEKHDRGGNYDEVLGATCAMFEIYNFYLGSEHEKTLTALQWILENYKDKVLFERASAIDILVRFNCLIEKEEIESFRQDILDYFKENDTNLKDNEFNLYRYCQTLFLCGFLEDTKNIALKFHAIQNYQDGKWVNISHTAAIVELLLKIQEKINPGDQQFEEMIFKGVEYLYDNYIPEQFSWNNEVLATAKSLRALRLFENKVSLPVDVVKNRIIEETQRISNYSAIAMASKLNLKYINECNALSGRITTLEALNLLNSQKKDKFRKIARLFFPLLMLFICIVTISIYIITHNELWPKVSKVTLSFLHDNLGAILISGISFMILAVIIILNEYNLIPENTPVWIKKLIARFVHVPGFNIPDDKKSD